jgi:hypothetical protein
MTGGGPILWRAPAAREDSRAHKSPHRDPHHRRRHIVAREAQVDRREWRLTILTLNRPSATAERKP